MPGFIGLPEIIIVLVIILVIFGPKRLPELGRSMGAGMKNFKESVSGKDKGHEELDSGAVRAQAADGPQAATSTGEGAGAAEGPRDSADVRS